MLLKYKKGPFSTVSTAVAVFLYEKKSLSDRAELKALQPMIQPLLDDGNFKPGYLKGLPVPVPGGWLLLVGLGKEEDFTPKGLLEAGATAAKMATDLGLTALTIMLPPAGDLAPNSTLELLAEGVCLAGYVQHEYKSEALAQSPLSEVIFLGRTVSAAGAREVLNRVEVTAEAVHLARKLGDAPPNFIYPQSFTQQVSEFVDSLPLSDSLELEIFDEKEMVAEKMGLISAVGQGSHHPPRLVVLSYKGADPDTPPVVLVGKGVTFDSGGLSLKPSGSLVGMKTDMAGAATVLAVTLAAIRLKMPINLITIMPLAENMPGGGAFRVGDVLTGRLGKTVEITNTDAEGRLLLADALTWAGELSPAVIVDVATLTGACVVALGPDCAGLFTENLALETALKTAASEAGEALWPLPLFSGYDSLLKSETADMVNASTVPKGGAITAALFLRRFVPKAVPWAHLDVAGPARAEKARPGTPAGATGFGVRTLIRYLDKLGQKV